MKPKKTSVYWFENKKFSAPDIQTLSNISPHLSFFQIWRKYKGEIPRLKNDF